MLEMMDLIAKLCDEVETVKGFLGKQLDVGGDYEAAVTASVRNGWGRCRKCG